MQFSVISRTLIGVGFTPAKMYLVNSTVPTDGAAIFRRDRLQLVNSKPHSQDYLLLYIGDSVGMSETYGYPKC